MIGITIKDSDTKNAIDKLESSKYKIIKIRLKTFTKISSNENNCDKNRYYIEKIIGRRKL